MTPYNSFMSEYIDIETELSDDGEKMYFYTNLMLADGELDGYEIECPRHGARFDIRSGKVLSMPAVIDVPWFPVRVEGDDIQIELEDE